MTNASTEPSGDGKTPMSIVERMKLMKGQLDEKNKQADLTQKQEAAAILTAENLKKQEALDAAKLIEDAKLKPTRDQIENLLTTEHAMNLIINSLEENPDLGDKVVRIGPGGKEYSNITKKSFEDESILIDTILKDSKEVIDSLNTEAAKDGKPIIETADNLVNHPDFADDPESLNYKNAKLIAEDLTDRNIKFKKMLIKNFGIEIGDDNFSYNNAIELLKDKKDIVAEDILIEKSKTPEGKEEVLNVLSKRIENDLAKDVPLYKDQMRNKDLLLSAGEMASLEKKFGSEIVKSAIIKAYERKVQSFLEKESQTFELDQKLKDYIEKTDEKKNNDVYPKIYEFIKLAQTFDDALQSKANELRDKGIDFNPINTWPGSPNKIDYGNFTELADEKDKEYLISKIGGDWAGRSDSGDHRFPPTINLDALNKYVSNKNTILKNLIQSVQNLNTKENIVELYNKVNHYKWNQRGTRFKEVRFSDDDQTVYQELKNFRSYDEAMEVINERELKRSKEKQSIMQSIETRVDMQVKEKELQAEIETQEFCDRVDHIERTFDMIWRDSREAEDILEKIGKIEEILLERDSVTNEVKVKQVVIKDGKVIVPEWKDRIDTLLPDYIKNTNEDIEKKELKNSKEIEDLRKPFGMLEKTWDKVKPQKIIDLNLKLEEVLKRPKELVRVAEKNKKIFEDKLEKCQILESERKNIYNMLKQQNILDGLPPGEIFMDIKAKLQEMKNKKAPESIRKLYKEYEALEKKLEG